MALLEIMLTMARAARMKAGVESCPTISCQANHIWKLTSVDLKQFWLFYKIFLFPKTATTLILLTMLNFSLNFRPCWNDFTLNQWKSTKIAFLSSRLTFTVDLFPRHSSQKFFIDQLLFWHFHSMHHHYSASSSCMTIFALQQLHGAKLFI